MPSIEDTFVNPHLNYLVTDLAEQLADGGGEWEPDADLTVLWRTSTSTYQAPRNYHQYSSPQQRRSRHAD